MPTGEADTLDLSTRKRGTLSSMLGFRLVGVALLAAFGLLNCGRSATADSPGATDSEASVGGAGGDAGDCGGAASDGGCTGVGGEPALAAYAPLRTACSLNVRVNRRGKPVCIDEHIR